MAGSIVRKNDNTNVIFEWESLSPKPELTIEDMAHLLWGRGRFGVNEPEDEPIVFEDLEEQDHLDIVGGYLKRVILDMARQHVIDSNAAAARENADILIQERHSLGENDG